MGVGNRAVEGTLSDFHFFKALRPFSFAVALMSCALGIRMAMLDGYGSSLKAILILIAGLLAQSGVNLINDMGDWSDLKRHQSLQLLAVVKRNFLLGLGAFFLAALIAIYLLQHTDPLLFWICLVGLIGALGYALPPIDLKGRGLAVVLVFWLMGVLMVSGAYLAMGGRLHSDVVLLSIPLSLLVSALLLANEIRDFEADKRRGLGTLSVRIGLQNARTLYLLLLIVSLLLPVVYYFTSGLLNPFWLIFSLPLLKQPMALQKQAEGKREALPPLTARFLIVFGLLYLLSLG